MRDIKLRAWNNKVKKFEKNFLIKCNEDTETFHPVSTDPINGKTENIINDHDITILLNTGLKDKKGVIGYHKDIVRDFRGDNYIIEWDDFYAEFILRKNDDNSYLPIYFLKMGEIIGNILQMPDFFNKAG